MKATLAIIPIAGGRPGDRRCVIDCRHGTTEAYVFPTERLAISDAYLVAAVLAKHRAEQPRCRCIRHLEARYGRSAA